MILKFIRKYIWKFIKIIWFTHHQIDTKNTQRQSSTEELKILTTRQFFEMQTISLFNTVISDWRLFKYICASNTQWEILSTIIGYRRIYLANISISNFTLSTSSSSRVQSWYNCSWIENEAASFDK